MTLVLSICLRLLVDCFALKLLFLRFWMLVRNRTILCTDVLYVGNETYFQSNAKIKLIADINRKLIELMILIKLDSYPY